MYQVYFYNGSSYGTRKYDSPFIAGIMLKWFRKRGYESTLIIEGFSHA